LPDQAAPTKRRLRIELLALDLATCGRCTRTEANLDAALRAAADLFREAEIDVETEKHVVTSADEARRLRFVSSPTIRVNGKDIALDLHESPCEDCGELCGCKGGVSCRVWAWQGKEYLEAPKAMIVDAILKAYGREETAPQDPLPYRMPDNLSAFFAGSAREEAKTPASSTTCCDKDSCCKPPSKNEKDSDTKAITH
jgi:glutaredoxin